MALEALIAGDLIASARNRAMVEEFARRTGGYPRSPAWVASAPGLPCGVLRV